MTKKEALEMLKYNSNVIHRTMDGRTDPREVEALDMAIKALEQEPCEDCISRQAVINAIANTCFWLSNDNWKELTKCINSISPVTPQSKSGKWIRVDKDKLRCSECEVIHFIAQYPQSAKINFCPNCGAKMRESEEEE